MTENSDPVSESGSKVIRILGCGSPLMGDDGVGIRIVEKLTAMAENDERLADVEILDAYTDPNSYETLDETFNPFNQITPGDVAELLKAEVDSHVEQAKADGLLASAREHAEKVVEAHVKALLTGTDLENCTVRVQWA